MRQAAAIWSEILESPFPYGLAGRPVKEAVKAHGIDTALTSFRRYCEHVKREPKYFNLWSWLRTCTQWLESRDDTVIRSGESLDDYQNRLAAR